MSELVLFANNDLLANVAIYGTSRVLMDILTSFAPTMAYLKSLWKRKATKETRGLMVNERVIEACVDYYVYYLTVNRTYCGRVLGDPRSRDDIIYYAPMSVMGDNGILKQYSDMTIEVIGRKIPFNRRVLGHVDYSKRHSIALLDEYGELWFYQYKHWRPSPMRRIPACGGVVMIGEGHNPTIHTEDIMLLDRLGNLYFLSNGCRVPSWSNIVYFKSDIEYVTTDGKINMYSERYFKPMITNNPHINDPNTEYPIVAYDRRSVYCMTADRTAYKYGRHGLEVIPDSENITQALIPPPKHSRNAIVIVDPYSE